MINLNHVEVMRLDYHGLAKIHKHDVPLRPVLSMPGSAYHKIALQVADWLKDHVIKIDCRQLERYRTG